MANDDREDLPDPISSHGDSREMFPSRFLSAADLIAGGMTHGQFATVTIADVLRRDDVMSQFTKKRATMWTLLLAGKQKELRCNKTMATTLEELFGYNHQDWKGKKVQLFLIQIQTKDGIKDSISIRGVPAQRPAPKPQAAAADPYEGMRPENESGVVKDETPF